MDRLRRDPGIIVVTLDDYVDRSLVALACKGQ
jgi:hypothetical protein